MDKKLTSLVFNPAFGRVVGYTGDKLSYSGPYTTPRPSAGTIVTGVDNPKTPNQPRESFPILYRYNYAFSGGDSLRLYNSKENLSDINYGKVSNDGTQRGMSTHGNIPGTAAFKPVSENVGDGITMTRRATSAQSHGCDRIPDMATLSTMVQTSEESRRAAMNGKPMVGTQGTEFSKLFDNTLFSTVKDAKGKETIMVEIASPTDNKLEIIIPDSQQRTTVKAPAVTLASIKEELKRDNPTMAIAEVATEEQLNKTTLAKNTIYVITDRLKKALALTGQETYARSQGIAPKKGDGLDTQPAAFKATVDGSLTTVQNSSLSELSDIGDRIGASYSGSGEDPNKLLQDNKHKLDIWDAKLPVAIINR
jgi:hypothetical protein